MRGRRERGPHRDGTSRKALFGEGGLRRRLAPQGSSETPRYNDPALGAYVSMIVTAGNGAHVRRLALIDGAGHWVQQEQPAEVAAARPMTPSMTLKRQLTFADALASMPATRCSLRVATRS